MVKSTKNKQFLVFPQKQKKKETKKNGSKTDFRFSEFLNSQQKNK